MLDIFVLKSLVFMADNFNAKVLFLLLIILFFKNIYRFIYIRIIFINIIYNR